MAEVLATEGFWLLVIGTILAGLVRGFSGFGTAMVFLPFAAQVYEPVWVLIVLIMIDMFGPIPAVPRALRDGHPWDVFRLCVGALVGLPFGFLILFSIPQGTFRYAIIAVSLCLLILLISGVRYRGNVSRTAVFGTGVLSGLFGGAVLLPGPPVILFYMARPLPVSAIRANTLLFLVAVDALMFLFIAFRGLFEWQPVITRLMLFPAYGIAILVGTAIFDPRHETVYRWVAYAIIAGSAVRGLPIWG